MKEMKRILALVLCFVMIVGMMPAIALNADAAGTVIDAAIFCSDVHGSSNDLSSVLGGVAKSGVDYSAIGFVGDTCLTVENTTSIVQSALSDTDIAVMFSYASSHDGSDIANDWDYSGEVEGVSANYLVYTIRETDMETTSGASTAAPAFTTWYNDLTAAQKALPIFIMSHRPLHDRRDDNAGAPTWYAAISAAAKTSDIVFFWAHNHTGESDVDTAAYYVEKNGTETITVYNGATVVPNFTYMNAGYINANNQNPARLGIATTVQITADSLIFQDYNSSGAYTGTNAHNVTVTRQFASTDSGEGGGSTDESTPATTDPTEGEEEGGTTTTTTYNYTATAATDGTGYILVSNGYALQNNGGTISAVAVTVSDDGSTITFADTVDVSTILWTIDSDGDVMNNGYYLLRSSGSGTKDMTISTTDSGDAYSNWTYTGTTLTTTGGSGGSTTFYAYCSDGTFSTQSSSSQELKFYVPTETEVEVTLSSIAVTTAPTKNVYNVGDTFSADGLVVTATYSDGSTAVVTPTSVSAPDMTTAGTKTVTVTYTEGDVTRTATFDITVNEVISDAATVTGIAVTGAKTEFNLGEALDTTGLVVTATYDDNGTTKTKVLDAAEYTVSEVDMTTEGEKTVTVSYTFNGITVTDAYTITVTEKPSNDVTVGGSVTTTKTKTVYVLTSGNPSGNVLIADSNTAGDVHLVANDGGDLSNVTTTVIYGDCDGDGDSEYYIELTDTEATNSLWTVSGSYTFENQDEYLRCSNGNLSVSGQSTTWSYSSNRLSYRSSGGGGGHSSSGSTTYYLCYDSSWDVTSSSADSIYFYVPTTVEYEETVDTTVNYTMRAEDLKQVVSDKTKTGTIDFCLQGNGTDLTTLPSGGSYSFSILADESDIIDSISADGTVNFTGTIGTATVKVAYTWSQDGETHTVYKNITVEASEPYYDLELHKANVTHVEATGLTEFAEGTIYYTKNEDGTYTQVSGDAEFDSSVTYYTLSYTLGDEITAPIAIKGIEAGDQYGVWAVVTYFDGTDENGTDMGAVGNAIEWSSSDPSVATVDPVTGIITFTGKQGTVNITATYLDGNRPSDTITISVTPSQYTIPSDGTTDFPEYPNEGAIRYDKTATAVGNFSETGIAQVELSMTGVPYTTGSEIDVVIMLDITGSMHDVTTSTYTYSQYTRVEATIIATMEFVKSIVVNEDGTYNNNRVGVYSFNSGGTYTLWELGKVTDLATINAAIQKFNDNYKSGGTPYDDGLSKVQSVLSTAKTDGTGNNRQQFAVFMTDGVPTDYEYITGTTHANYSEASDIAAMLTSSDNYKTRDTDYKYEYYSTEMKGDGVTVYTVGIGLENTNSAWSGTATQCLNLASRLLNDISGPAGETTQPDAVGTSTLSKQDSYFFSVDDANAATDMKNVFTNIAMSILQAATDVTVEDKIADEYTMIFDIPEGSKNITGVTNDFYIEFVKYTLDENHERVDADSDGDTYDDATSVTKLYLKNTNGELSAAKDSSGTAYDEPVFEQKLIGDKGTLYYWTTDDSYASKAAVTYTNSDDTYYFIPYGVEQNEDGTAPDGWYNMTSGAYAYGKVDSTNMSDDLVIATPYFVYNAATRMIYWTVDKLENATTEYALRYFLYLDNSATEVGEDAEVDPGSYLTNDYAYITYTNFKGNDCRQEFPKPQLTWSGAQVSYVFYLVNAQGQPINKSGQVVDFANATFVTDIYTENTVWNKGEDGQITADSQLSIDWLAANLLPSDYKVYDEAAQYQLHVYGDHTGESIFDYFTIGGSDATTISSSLNNRLTNVNTTASTVSLTTTKVYNTKAGQKITGYGTYTSEATDKYDNETVLSNFDFYNTTVAFAVVWQPSLAPDTIVVDYGLDVLINVTFNDLMQDNTISGIGLGRDAYGGIVENTGISTTSKLGAAALTTPDGSTISIEPAADDQTTQIRFSQNDMTFNAPVTFYYESEVEYYENSEMKTGYLHTSVTVIPATTIYYEDEYVTLTTHTRQEDGSYVKTEGWTDNSTAATATQAQDRPGTTSITGVLDADNNYGYDAAYSAMSTYSMNSAAKITVSDGIEGQANFDFYGTGFDVISLTDTTTGTITVRVYEYNEDGSLASKPLHSYVVDTYYGYKQDENGDWVTTDSNDPNALYQVPVMKISGLEYGKYRARIVVFYDEFFDNMDNDSSYDFYLDAIRIYDPTGNKNDVANDAYVKDGEGWPSYFEVRDQIIAKSTFDSLNDETVSGIVFIDGAIATPSIQDYTSFGPNNETYLANNQAVAFDLNGTYTVPEGMKLAKIQLAIKSVAGAGKVEVYGVKTDGTKVPCLNETISTATDMYYDISALEGMTVVIKSTGDAVISITNVKVTYEPDASAALATASEEETEAPMLFSVRRSTANTALATLNVEEEVPETTVPEETEPETTVPEETEPETSVPEETEPETSVPEETEPETTTPEETEPEETKPSHQEQAEQVIRKVVKIIKGFLDWIFG